MGFGTTQRAFLRSGRSVRASVPNSSAGGHHIGGREHAKQLGSLLRQSAVTRLSMPEQVLRYIKGMLDLCTLALPSPAIT
jgi:hypothetical protein